MRVILATLNFPPAAGGIEQVCAELARELCGLGIELCVLAPEQPGSAAFDLAAGYPVRRYRPDRARHVRLARELRIELGRHPGSVVLFAQWTAAGAALASARVRGARLFALAHAKELLKTASGWRSTRGFEAYRRAVLGKLTAMLAVSEFSAELARRAGAREVHVIHPGVDAERFTAVPTGRTRPAAEPDRPVVLTVARLVQRKGIDTMIAALPAVARRHPGVRYRVVGDGPDRARLLALAAQHGVADRCEFAGAATRDALPTHYRSADVFVLASRQDPISGDVEGFGLVLLEAQAAGTAVIAARSGGMPDALVPGETGLLVPPDDPAAFAAAVVELLDDRGRLRAMGDAAQRYALTRTWRATAEEVAARIKTN